MLFRSVQYGYPSSVWRMESQQKLGGKDVHTVWLRPTQLEISIVPEELRTFTYLTCDISIVSQFLSFNYLFWFTYLSFLCSGLFINIII